jgi:[ribosomal protein S5]-alanine N-acetyltransferase
MILETERLTLEELTFQDAPFILELLNSPRWLRFIGDRGVKNLKDAAGYIANGPHRSYKTYGYGLFKVTLKEGIKPIGMCGFLHRDYLEHPDIGFAFLDRYCRTGYGYEIASATILHFQNSGRIGKLHAITIPDNESSIFLLKKLGFSLENEIERENEHLLLFTREANR